MSKKKTVSALLLTAALSCSLFVGSAGASASVSHGGNAQPVFVSQTANDTSAEKLKDKYTQGEKITISGFEDGGVDYSPVYLKTPSGVTVRYSAEYELKEAGVYTVKFEGLASGKKVTKEQTFTVNSPLYSLGRYSTAEYGKIPDDYYESRLADIDTTEELKNKSGLKVALASNEVFTYNRVLNLKGCSFDTPVLQLFCLPENVNDFDAKRIRIKLTDIYDSDNFMELFITSCTPETGMPHVSAIQVGYNGNYSHKNHWAPGAFIRFSGNIDVRNSGQQSSANIFNLLYDDSSLSLNCNPGVYAPDRDGALPSFSDGDSFENPWSGFTTGECILTIEGVNIKSKALNLILFDILGDDLTGDVWVDDREPVFNVDFEGYDISNLPNAIKGQPYKLFKANTISGDVKTEVYYNYDSEHPVLVKNDGKTFTPEYEGPYTIVYSMTNGYGKRTQISCNLYADGEKSFDFEILGKTLAGKSGTVIKTFEGFTESGLHGVSHYSVTAVHKASGKVYEISDENTFIPLDAGVYEVTVNAGDYVTQKSKKFSMVISAGDTPLCTDEPVVPKYLIKDAKYTLPELKGMVFSSGNAVEQYAYVKVYCDGSTQPLAVSDGKIKIPDGQIVKFVFTLTDAKTGNSIVKEKSAEIVDTGYADVLHSTGYFKGTKGEWAKTDVGSGLRLDTNASQAVGGSAGFEFINAVQTHNFVLDFNAFDECTKFSSLTLKLTDIADEDNYVAVRLAKSGSDTYVTVNGGTKSYKLPGNLFNPSSTALSVGYSSERNAVMLYDKTNGSYTAIKVQNRADGAAFNGFTGERAYLSLDFDGISGNTSLLVIGINNQRFGNLDEDLNMPQYFTAIDNGLKTPGTVIDLPAVDITDVLDPDVEISLRVTDTEGNVVKSVDGTALNNVDGKAAYSFVLENEGTYRISYKISDYNNERTMIYMVTVKENKIPTLTLNGELVKKANKGDTINFVDATVSEGATLKIYLLRPGSSKLEDMTLSNGEFYKSFVAVDAGIYNVYYTVIDSDNNFITKTFSIEVK